MTLVAIVYQKGGIGKTTLATSLGWSLAEIETALLVDADPRGSARGWKHCNINATRACLCKGIQPTRVVPTRSGAYQTSHPRPG